MKNLYLRLSSVYFIYYAFVGGFVPYWGLYLKSLHFSPTDIGLLLSLFQFSRVFAPSFWGWLTDHTQRRTAWIKLTAGLGMVSFVGVFFGTSFAWLFMVMAILSLFTSSTLPLLESSTLALIKRYRQPDSHSYSHIRLWGSIGFVVAVISLGLLLDYYSVEVLLWVLLGLQIILFALTFSIPEPAAVKHTEAYFSIWQVLKNRTVLATMFTSVLMVGAHSVYYSFFSIYMESHGYSKSIIGLLWAIGVLCEIGIFIIMPKILTRVSLKNIIILSLTLAVLRFGIIGLQPNNVWLIVLVQALHAMTFGAFHASSIEIIEHYFKGRHQARGQAIYNSMGYGVGGVIGGVTGGLMMQHVGGQATFLLAASYPLIGIFIVAIWLKVSQDSVENNN